MNLQDVKNLVCYFDGCCEPRNPGGNMGMGAIVTDAQTHKEYFKYSGYIPEHYSNSNNVAEYMAFERLLDWLKENALVITAQITIYGDSMLVICQMTKQWRIKNGRYVPYADRCKKKLAELREEFKVSISLGWVRRTENHLADKLSKQPLLDKGVEFKLQKA